MIGREISCVSLLYEKKIHYFLFTFFKEKKDMFAEMLVVLQKTFPMSNYCLKWFLIYWNFWSTWDFPSNKTAKPRPQRVWHNIYRSLLKSYKYRAKTLILEPFTISRGSYICIKHFDSNVLNKRPMGHIAHLRKQFKSINTNDYIITLIKRRKKNTLTF